MTPLLHALTSPPSATPILNPANVSSIHLAALLFSHLLRSSPRVKSLARLIIPSPVAAVPEHSEGAFFVPADGTPPLPAPPPESDDEEPPQTLLQIINENLSLAFLSRSRAETSDRESREWDRLVVGYLCLLSQWLWEDPKSVREFLDAGGLGIVSGYLVRGPSFFSSLCGLQLVEPINQTSNVDSIVPALCAFLLGICYEYDREPGEITRLNLVVQYVSDMLLTRYFCRATIHPILTRLGVDKLVGQMARLREDERFKAVGPENPVLSYPASSYLQPGLKPESDDEGEIWFDWAFIDFWKSNYCLFFYSLRPFLAHCRRRYDTKGDVN
jgi:intracellular protein transport protein USO1